jgi:hypothetical protein
MRTNGSSACLSVAFRRIQVLADALYGIGIDEGPQIDVVSLIGATDAQAFGEYTQPIHQPIGDGTDGHGHAAGHTALSAAEIG